MGIDVEAMDRAFIGMQHKMGYDVFLYEAAQKRIIPTIHGEHDPSLDAFEHMYPGFDRAALDQALARVLESGQNESFRAVYHPSLHREKELNIVLMPNHLHPEDPFCYIIVQDVGEDEAAEDILTAQDPGARGFHRLRLSPPMQVEYVSQSLAIMLGYTRKELFEATNGRYMDLIAERDRPAAAQFLGHMAKRESTDTIEYRMLRRDGSLLYVSETMSSRLSEDGVMRGYAMVRDLSPYKEQEERYHQKLESIEEKAKEYEQESRIDYLTGLPNRTAMEEMLQKAAAGEGEPIRAAYMIDIDSFKSLNDTYGHLYGDMCLKEICQGLRTYGRSHGITFYRYGGEEFLGIQTTGEEDPQDLAAGLVALMRELHVQRDDVPLGYVTASIGYTTAEATTARATSTDLVARADQALYEAKAQGKNRAVLYRESH